MIYVLYGQPASGKTTLGEMLADYLETPFIIDGDEFREMFTNENYGREGREENIRNANAVATYLSKKGARDEWSCVYFKKTENSIQGRPVKDGTDVVLCLVNPYEKLREELTKNNAGQVFSILLTSERQLRREYHVEDFEKGSPTIVLNTDRDPKETFKSLANHIKELDTIRICDRGRTTEDD